LGEYDDESEVVLVINSCKPPRVILRDCQYQQSQSSSKIKPMQVRQDG
jgi:hypothetical protein